MPHHDEMADGNVRRAPEDEHLAEQERLLAELTDQLATREAEFATAGTEFARFRATYLARFAPLYSELDRLEADIARLLADRMEFDGTEAAAARAHAEQSEARAAESESAAETAGSQPEAPPEPTTELKALYRQVAKIVHPDLATDDIERARRTRLMASASEAYRAGDEAALHRIFDNEAARPEAVVGDDTGAKLVRVLRKTAQVRGRFDELDEMEQALRDDPMWTLFEAVRTATSNGEDPLSETEAGLRARTRSARTRLDELRSGATRAP